MQDEVRAVEDPEAPPQHLVVAPRTQVAALVHEQVLPVLEANNRRLQAVLDSLLADESDLTDAVVAVTAALGEMRGAEHRLVEVLAAEPPEDLDGEPDLVRQLTACGRRLSAAGRFSFEIQDSRSQESPPAVERALLQIAIEALERSAHHAGATKVRVRLADRCSGVELTVADDGSRPPGAGRDQSDQLGVRLLDRRARTIGGRVRVEPGLVGGTIVTCWVPHPDEAPAGVDEGRPAAC